MSLIQKQFLLPILIGVSFTSISIALIYCWYKKDDDDSVNEKHVYGRRYKLTRECKVPRQFVPAVIGRGGATIKEVENKSATRIRFKEDNIECPDRVYTIQGTMEGLNLAEAMIKNIIANQPIIETYEMYVPRHACRRIIGRGGETIQQIQLISSAKIIVESGFSSKNPDAEQRIIIKGTAEQIATALSQIEDKVREEKQARMLLENNSFTRLPRGKLSPRNTAANVPESSVEFTGSVLQLDGDGLMEVYLSAMESPSQFFIQLVGSNTIALDKLVSDMTAYYNDKENYEMHALKKITEGQIVAAKFSFDDCWYRAEILSPPSDGVCEVYFVDYGDRERVDTSHILELPTNFLSLRVQAVECSLANVKPCEDEWSEEACNRFAELTWLAQWKIIAAKVRGYKERIASYGGSRREGSPIPSLELYDRNDNKDINVAEELIKEGYAQPEEITIVSRPQSKATEVIDLTKESIGPIETVDLVTPVKNQTRNFMDNERTVSPEDGSGDHLRNGKEQSSPAVTIIPAGYESDLSDDSNGFELG